MSNEVQAFFRLKSRPFDKTVDDRSLWLDSKRTDAIDRLVAAVKSRQHSLVVGEPGVGKNCVIRGLRAQCPQTAFRLHYVAHVSLGKRDFYKQICMAYGIETKSTSTFMFNAIQANMASMARDRVHPVLILDEAHLMQDSALSTLHILSNFEWDAAPLMSLVLVGLPELKDRLKLGIHRSLLTRISLKVEVEPTNGEATAAYVANRLLEAGCERPVFTQDALVVLHELTGGVLRCIDLVASGSLAIAARQKNMLVERQMVHAAFQLTPLA